MAEEAPDWATVCLNCQAPRAGPFCSQCGQRAVPPHPTTRELAGDAYAEVIGWDGRVARTVRLLLLRPGELTRALLDGQRRHYISPVRLYLTCSVLYFIVAAGAPLPDVNAEFDVGIGFGVDTEEQTPGEAAFGKAILEGLATLSPGERAALEAWIQTIPPMLQPMARDLAADYPAVMRRVGDMMPRTLFILIPALAAVLSLFYRSRPYPDHLYFALHFGAFVFIALTVEALLLYSRSLVLIAIAQVVVYLGIVGYVVVAQHRVYGGSWLRTGLKAVGVAALYGVLWSTTVIGLMLWTSRSN